jgi:Dyp-type peroxidase family
MDHLEFKDIQGIVIRGYKELSFARFVLIGISEPDQARSWLGGLSVTPASDPKSRGAIHIAFTAQGLTALGLSAGELAEFALEFREGMSSGEHRPHMLGDEPEKWDWGGPKTLVDAILLLYAETPAILDELEAQTCGVFKNEHERNGICVKHRLATHTLRDGTRNWFREHFGFRDGVAQPSLAIDNPGDEERGGGISKASDPANTVRAGEFLFGHPTEYGKNPEGGGPPRIAKNGSFLVFRQLEQNVIEFWTDIRKKAKEARLDPILLASKMVGRWPNGAPLVHAPDEATAGLETFDAFGYHASDPKGQLCPFSAHIRRSNPRDTLVDDPAESIKLAKTHRLVRRGRPYGPPIFDPLDPAAFLPKLDTLARNPSPPGGRGLHFLCFNTGIRRQFEFVQQTWLNNPKFAGQYATPDPIAGHFEGDGFEFLLPGKPARERITQIKSFVQSRGGAYFFMPGISALRVLARSGA